MNYDTSLHSRRQAAVLKYIRTYVNKKGYPPSRREMEAALDLSSASISQLLDELEKQGTLIVARNTARSLRLPGNPAPAPQLRIPILGRIPSGLPAAAPEPGPSFFGRDQVVEISRNMLPPHAKKSVLFALQVAGNGLIDLLIQDGDLAILESLPHNQHLPQFRVKDGETVAVRLPSLGQTALTRLYRDRKGYRLQPANPAASSVLVEKKTPIEIEGRLVGVIRSFRD